MNNWVRTSPTYFLHNAWDSTDFTRGVYISSYLITLHEMKRKKKKNLLKFRSKSPNFGNSKLLVMLLWCWLEKKMLRTQQNLQLLLQFSMWWDISGEGKWWVHTTFQNYSHNKLWQKLWTFCVFSIFRIENKENLF